MVSIQVSLGSVERAGSQVNSGLSVILVLRGTVTLKSPEQNRSLRENDYAFLNHNDFYTLDSSGPNVFLWVNMERSWLEFVCPDKVNNRYYCCSTVSNPATQPMFDSIRQRVIRAAMLYYRHEKGYGLLIQAELIQVLHTLSLYFCTGTQRPISVRASDRLAPVLEFMNRNFREPITLEATAREFYLSDTHLSRLFRRELNMTFVEYLTSLRLENARRELLHTDISITRLALNSGFSSVKSFNQYFRRAFGSSPAQYRHQADCRPEKAETLWLEAGVDGSLELLARFVESYENQPQGADACPRVELPGCQEHLKLPPFILEVGDFDSALRGNVRRQIREAQRRIGFSYALMSGLFRQRSKSLLRRYDGMELLAELVELGMTPMILVDLDKEGDNLEYMLGSLTGQFGRRELVRWRFALCGGPERPVEDFIRVVGLLRQCLPGVEIGMQIKLDRLPQWEKFGQKDWSPDFIMTGMDPNDMALAGDAFSYERFQKRYHQNQLNRVRGWMEEHGCIAPVCLVGWNTLTGRSLVESGRFHRTALVVDTLMALRNDVAGYGVRLDLGRWEDEKPEHLTYPLSLYLYQNIKRPIFFVLQWLKTLGDCVVWEEPGGLVTRSGEGEYQVLLWHPCYIDPFFSLEEVQEDRYSRRVCLTLRGLTPGTYRIKRLYLDKDHGSTYSSWIKIDMAAQLDQDILDHLSRASNPAVTLEYRTVEGELKLAQTLSLNGAALWSVVRVDVDQ